MRFAFVTTNLSGGGAEKALLKLAELLIQRGHEAKLWLLENTGNHAVPAIVPVQALSQRTGHGWLGKRLAANRLKRALKKCGPWDLVVSTLPFADEVTALSGLTHHWCRIANTLSEEIARLPGKKANRRSERYSRLYGSRRLIAVSSGVAHDLLCNLKLTSRIEVIPNPFNAAAIREAAIEIDNDLPQVPYVIHVGRFATQKRHDLLLDAWKKIKTDHVLVLLTNPEARLEQMIVERGLQSRVRVVGFKPNPYPWIAQADLLVLCSDHEGLPNVLIEAILCGTPAISTDCPSGPGEILNAVPDCLVPCGDSEALASAINLNLYKKKDITLVDLSAYEDDCVAAAYEHLAKENVRG